MINKGQRYNKKKYRLTFTNGKSQDVELTASELRFAIANRKAEEIVRGVKVLS